MEASTVTRPYEKNMRTDIVTDVAGVRTHYDLIFCKIRGIDNTASQLNARCNAKVAKYNTLSESNFEPLVISP